MLSFFLMFLFFFIVIIIAEQIIKETHVNKSPPCIFKVNTHDAAYLFVLLRHSRLRLFILIQ